MEWKTWTPKPNPLVDECKSQRNGLKKNQERYELSINIPVLKKVCAWEQESKAHDRCRIARVDKVSTFFYNVNWTVKKKLITRWTNDVGSIRNYQSFDSYSIYPFNLNSGCCDDNINSLLTPDYLNQCKWCKHVMGIMLDNTKRILFIKILSKITSFFLRFCIPLCFLCKEKNKYIVCTYINLHKSITVF